jgi:hypothetical protein
LGAVTAHGKKSRWARMVCKRPITLSTRRDALDNRPSSCCSRTCFSCWKARALRQGERVTICGALTKY